MIISFMLYSLLVAAFMGAAAWLVDRALGVMGAARRGAWVVAVSATVLLPVGAVALRVPVTGSAPIRAVGELVMPGAGQVVRAFRMASSLQKPRLGGWSLDRLAAGAWILSSLSFIGMHVIGAWRLGRRARRWHAARIGSVEVAVSSDVGPAVYGWWRPRVVFPVWLMDAGEPIRRQALAHEQQHLAARDPQLLAAATVLGALLPWNAPLLWMLRRLRFALEVDCDARVLRGGTDASDYGLALLYVSERQARAPLATVALIERPSQLERRIDIMITAPRRHRRLIAGLCLMLAATCVFAAAQLEAPARATAEAPLKPTPDGGAARKLGQRFETLLLERYPTLLESDTGGEAGTAIVVVRLNRDWSVDKAAQVFSKERIENVVLDESVFAAIGVNRADVPYVGAMGMRSPDDPHKSLLVAYTEQPPAGKHFVSYLFPDTRAVDREIFRRHFPELNAGGVPAGAGLWVLLDRDGHVLRSGQDAVSPKELNRMLESRFPGIETQAVTVTPVVDADGQPLQDGAGQNVQLMSVWLAPGSPPLPQKRQE